LVAIIPQYVLLTFSSLCIKDFLSQEWCLSIRVLYGLLFSHMNFSSFLNFHSLSASTASCSKKFHFWSIYCGKKSLTWFVLKVQHASWCAPVKPLCPSNTLFASSEEGHSVTFSKVSRSRLPALLVEVVFIGR